MVAHTLVKAYGYFAAVEYYFAVSLLLAKLFGGGYQHFAYSLSLQFVVYRHGPQLHLGVVYVVQQQARYYLVFLLCYENSVDVIAAHVFFGQHKAKRLSEYFVPQRYYLRV